MREFAFELALCAHLERTSPVVARQLGGGVECPGGRVLDVVTVERGPEFDERVAITGESIPASAIESDAGVGRARFYRDCFDCSPAYAAEVVDRAVEVGFFERERRNGRDYVRQVARYPDWFGTIRGIENKPDLADPGALEAQLRTDVSLGLLDEVILATGSYVTRAHLNRIPEEVGVWRVDPDLADPDAGDSGTGTDPGEAVEVVREPTPLAPDEPGIELLDRGPTRADVVPVTAEAKARARRRLAERAYGKGWRTHAFPSCARVADRSVAGGGGLPYCEYLGRIVDPASECGPACAGYDPDDPPETDHAAERDRRTPWTADPEGLAREQSGLDRFR